MAYSNIHESEDKAEFILSMLVVFNYIGIFTLLLGIGFIWGSKVYWYEELMSKGVRSTDWSIDWDSASKGRAGRSAYAYDYYNIIVKYKVEGGKGYQDYATMSVGNYQLLSQGHVPKSVESTDDVELLYLPDDLGVTLLYPYEEADYLQFYIGWVVVVVSLIFIVLGIVAKVIIRRSSLYTFKIYTLEIFS